MSGFKDKLSSLTNVVFSWNFPILTMIFDGVNEILKNSITISLDSLVEQISEKTNLIVQDICINEKLTFIGGSCEFNKSNIINDEVFIVHLKLYFQTQEKKFLLKEKSKIFPLSKLNEKSKEDLIRDSIISYSLYK